MKYLLSLVFGILVGTACAAALLFFNPLTRSQGSAAADDAWVLSYSMRPADLWVSTHDDSVDLPVVPADLPLLYEQGIKGSILMAMPLQFSGGQAQATRISVPSANTEFLQSGFVTDDYWLVSVPGRGSLFVHAESNQWPLLRDTLVSVNWLRRDWKGAAEYLPTRGPVRAGASVLGLSGEFAGISGHAKERIDVLSYDSSALQLSGELLLELDDSAP